MKYLLLFTCLVLGSLVASAGPVDLNAADADTIARELNGVGNFERVFHFGDQGDVGMRQAQAA